MRRTVDTPRRIRRADRRLINCAAWRLFGVDFLWGRHSMLKAFAQWPTELSALDFVRAWEENERASKLAKMPLQTALSYCTVINNSTAIATR
jgi:hypothetical protein